MRPSDVEITTIHRGLVSRYGDDAAQEAIMRLLEANPSPDDPRAWCAKVARNYQRSEARRLRGVGGGPKFVRLNEEGVWEPWEPAVPANQLTQLEARDDLRGAPRPLLEEALGGPRLTKVQRHRARKDAKGKKA